MINSKMKMPRHIIIEMAKIEDTERILKLAWGKQHFRYKGTLVRRSGDFSTETLRVRKE